MALHCLQQNQYTRTHCLDVIITGPVIFETLRWEDFVVFVCKVLWNPLLAHKKGWHWWRRCFGKMQNWRRIRKNQRNNAYWSIWIHYTPLYTVLFFDWYQIIVDISPRGVKFFVPNTWWNLMVSKGDIYHSVRFWLS